MGPEAGIVWRVNFEDRLDSCVLAMHRICLPAWRII